MNNYPLQHKASELIIKHLSGTLTTVERIELEEWINETPEHKKLFEELNKEEMLRADVKEIPELKNRILHTIYSQLPGARDTVPFYRRSFLRVAAAAVVILMISIGGYFYFNKNTPKEIAATETKKQFKNDVAPGKQGAILTLGNGKQIVLDNIANGKISEAAVKEGSQVSYVDANTKVAENNTMSTPKGRQFELVLADGSKVWLNAASSITYPTAFTGSERKVSITGEAYFEVAHNDKMPFVVQHNEVSIQVLGTHFNVNAYDDEVAMKTTLLEGSVKVSRGNSTSLLKPGQQAQIIKSGEIIVMNADVDETMAWKNGLFHFESADLKTILRQFARWYDVEVIYEGKIPDDKFFVIVNRNSTLSSVLKALQANGIKFRIEDKKLIVEAG